MVCVEPEQKIWYQAHVVMRRGTQYLLSWPGQPSCSHSSHLLLLWHVSTAPRRKLQGEAGVCDHQQRQSIPAALAWAVPCLTASVPVAALHSIAIKTLLKLVILGPQGQENLEAVPAVLTLVIPLLGCSSAFCCHTSAYWPLLVAGCSIMHVIIDTCCFGFSKSCGGDSAVLVQLLDPLCRTAPH